MAASSYPQYQYRPLHIDPIFSQLLNSTPTKISSYWEEYPNNTQTSCFAQFLQPDAHQSLLHHQQMGIPVDVSVHESSNCLENSTKVADLSYNDTSVTNKHSTDSSTVVDKPAESSEQVTQKVFITPMDKKRKGRDLPKVTREVKGKKQKKSNGVMKDGDDDQENKPKADDHQKDQKKGPDHDQEAPTGYIHVRARRGQATDSHSLAERVRREKISERMKLLQALVPGCDKVTGKALILDEIINYVQSLQNQVEFLSLKLASLNPMLYDFGVDLDAFMVTPERLNYLVSPLPNVQQCNPTQATAFSDATTSLMTGSNSYTLLDTSSPHLFQQGQTQNILSQDNRQVLWDMDGRRQKLINQSGFISNLCSFH